MIDCPGAMSHARHPHALARTCDRKTRRLDDLDGTGADKDSGTPRPHGHTRAIYKGTGDRPAHQTWAVSLTRTGLPQQNGTRMRWDERTAGCPGLQMKRPR